MGGSGGVEAGGAPGGGGGVPPSGGSGGAISEAFVEPTSLSKTGLYADMASQTLAAGVTEYRPKYELWSDGAVKRRFVYLPPNTTIDTSEMDRWVYPVGTKLWKEFKRDGVRVETRLIQKYLDANQRGKWFMAAFIWNQGQTEADIAKDGMMNASGTPHDVPDTKTCGECHSNVYDRVLGFSALQLSHTFEGPNLMQLATQGKLTHPPTAPFALPGSEAQQNALGYMHANCGTCHNPNSQHAALNMEFWLTGPSLARVEDTTTYTTTVGKETQSMEKPVGDVGVRLTPKDPDKSAIMQRMTLPIGVKSHMPQIATEITDEQGVALVRAFIQSLEPVPAP